MVIWLVVAALVLPGWLFSARPVGAQGLSQVLIWPNGSDYTGFGGNETIEISIGSFEYVTQCGPSGGIPDSFGLRAANVYIVPAGTIVPGVTGALKDVGGSPNTISGTGTAFTDQIIGFARPQGKIPPGRYAIVYDECQNGVLDPVDAVFDPAFEVVIDPNVPPLPNNEMFTIKARAAQQAADWTAITQRMLLTFAVTEALEALSAATDPVDLMMWTLQAVGVSAFGKSGYTDPKDSAIANAINMIRHYASLANDPPDANFAQPVALGGRATLDPQSADPLTQALITLGNATANDDAELVALVHALEKYQGTQATGPGQQRGVWAAAQARAIRTYAAGQAAQLGETDAALAALASALAADTRPIDSTAATLEARRAAIVANGFSDADLKVLRARGLTDDQLIELQTTLGATSFGGTKADLLASITTVRNATVATQAAFSGLAGAMTPIIATLSAAGTDDHPVVSIGGPYTGTVGAAVAFTGSAVAGDFPVVGYAWDLNGDGEFNDATGATPNHTYTQPFAGLIGLRVTNSAGRVGIAYTRLTVAGGNGRVQITNSSPTGGPAIPLGASQAFGVATSDPDGDAVAVRWTLDGGQVGTGPTYTLTGRPYNLGPHTLLATATDGKPLGTAQRVWYLSVVAPDADGDGWRANVDCDDTNPQVGYCPAPPLPPDPANTLTVTSTSDSAACPNGPGGAGYTLRCAITDANTAGAGKRIAFNIPAVDTGCAASGVCTITPTDSLPILTASSTVIDGYTQPGAQVNTAAPEQGTNAIIRIRIDGAQAATATHPKEAGVVIGGSNNFVRGLSITNFTYIAAIGGIDGLRVTGDGNTIAGNLLGVTPDGTPGGNGARGNLVIWDGKNNTVGGTRPADRNVVADGSSGINITAYNGTPSGNRILGNLVGTNFAGTAALGRLQQYGIAIAGTGNIVGGTTAGARNIVGNSIGGLLVGANTGGSVEDNRVIGNYIGLNATGTAAIPNWNGINASQAGNLISGNVISGNSQSGIAMTYTAGAAHDKIVGNIVGLNAAGTAAIGNGNYGMQFSSTIGLTIGGTTTAERNVISGNALAGISFNSHYDNYGRTADNHILGNYIGTNAAGTAAIPNGQHGIELQGVGGIAIGGTTAGSGNLIAGNQGSGVAITNYFQNSQPTGNVVQGNRIGVAADGTTPLGNAANGVLIDATGFNTIGGTATGAGNLIANNGGAGVRLDGGADVHARIVGNRSVANGGLGIDLAPAGTINCAEAGMNGPNGYLHCPIIRAVSASLVSGTGPVGATVDVYLVGTAADPSGHGEALIYLGSATIHGCGDTWSLPGLNLPTGAVVTATASILDGASTGTSEFAANATRGLTDPLFVPNVASAANQQGTIGSPATLDLGSFGENCPTGPWGVAVNWGDNTANATFQAAAVGALGTQAHTFASGGTKTVTVTVTNKIGGSNSATFQVVVATVAPGAPQNVVAAPGNTSATVTWATPGSDGGSAIDRYDLSIAPTAGGAAQTQQVTLPATLAATFTGLTNGTGYTASVTAHNANGSGPAATAVATPAEQPAALVVAAASGTYGGTTTLGATLTLGGQPLAGKMIAFTLNGNAIGTATTDGSGVATLQNASLAGIAAGSYPTGVGATFAGDGTAAATSGTAALTIAKASQTLTFGPLADRQLGSAAFQVSATASSGLIVAFAASGSCTVAGMTVTLTAVGTCTVTASQAGNTNYAAAMSVASSFAVTAAPPTQVRLTLTVVGGGTVLVAPPGTASGGGVFSFDPGTPVQLTAQPGVGQVFTGWTVDGAVAGWASPLTVTMNAAHAIQATFAPAPAFPDVTANRADADAIANLAARGTIRGYGNGSYGPDDGVQRAQMAALIARATLAGPGTPTNGTLTPPGCIAAGTWDCEDWGNGFGDRNGLIDSLWRNVGALQHYQVAFGYDGAACAAKGVASPCYAPTASVSYVETIVFITRAMVAKGYWVTQPGAPQPHAGVPAVFATEVATFNFYTQAAGGIPALPPGKGWNDGATRGWFARALWVALNTYWGTDSTLPDGRNAGGFVP